MKTHREQYPEQYRHPMVGRRVRVLRVDGSTAAAGTVERVVRSERWGELAEFEDQGGTFWRVGDLVEERPDTAQ